MSTRGLLKSRFVNGWYLFVLISAPISTLVIFELISVDFSAGAGVSHMIGYSVRFAIPLIFVVIATSALRSLFPGEWSTWLLRNRKYVGLCFAVAMAWQGLFILTMSLFFRDYYYEDIYLLRDEIEGSVGYLFLAAMVVTSFRLGRQQLSQQQWRILHTSGVYFLWAYPFSTYWWTVVGYYGEVTPFAWALYLMGFAAFAARIAAWGKRRLRLIANSATADHPSLALRIAGGVFIGFGLAAAATSMYWQQGVTAWLTAADWSARLALWLPYWPFEPFLPLLAVGIGTMLATTAKVSSTSSPVAIRRS